MKIGFYIGLYKPKWVVGLNEFNKSDLNENSIRQAC